MWTQAASSTKCFRLVWVPKASYQPTEWSIQHCEPKLLLYKPIMSGVCYGVGKLTNTSHGSLLPPPILAVYTIPLTFSLCPQHLSEQNTSRNSFWSITLLLKGQAYLPSWAPKPVDVTNTKDGMPFSLFRVLQICFECRLCLCIWNSVLYFTLRRRY